MQQPGGWHYEATQYIKTNLQSV